MLNFCDFIQDYVFSTNHHLNCCVGNRVGLGIYKLFAAAYV